MKFTAAISLTLAVSCVLLAETPADLFPPPSPAGIAVSKNFSNVTVSWPAVPRISSYMVECRIKRYFLFNRISRVEKITATLYTLRYPYSLSRYSFRVYAVAGSLTSSPSEEVSVVSPIFGGQELQYIRL